MRGQHHDVQDLSRLAGLKGDELRATFRRAVANLASRAAVRSLPLEGVDPHDLLVSMRLALAEGLFHDLSWLSAAGGALAIYEIMAALPPSEERQELNQAVVTWLSDADTSTFVALATALARGTREAFSSAPLRARVSLALALPLGCPVRADGLALALLSQPDHVRAWVERPSQGALPSRRLAARLLERAAREAARLAAQRDDAGLRSLERPAVRAAWDRLLADREALVWRHVASARGLLSVAVPRFGEEIRAALSPDLTATEWRRGAASLVASLAVTPTSAVAAIQSLLGGPVIKSDPGVVAAMMFGVPRAAESEPEIAEKLLPALLRLGGVPAAEAYLELLGETLGRGFGQASRELASSLLTGQLSTREVMADDSAVAIIEWLMQRFDPQAVPDDRFDQRVAAALRGFVSDGPALGSALARQALESAEQTLAELTTADPSSVQGRATIVRGLAEFDLGLLTGSTLADLVALENDGASKAALFDLFERLTAWLLSVEQAPVEQAGRVAHAALRMRRIRTLLHLVDGESSYGDESSLMPARTSRRQRTARVLLNRALKEAQSPLRRAVLACLTRAFDALVRDEVFELSDVILCAALYLPDADDVVTLSEACMVPDLSASLSALGVLVRHVAQGSDSVTTRREGIRAIEGIVAALPAAHSPRVSMLRWCLLRLQLTLEVLYDARSQGDLVAAGGTNVMDDLSDALYGIAQLASATRKRLSPNAQTSLPAVGVKVRALADVLEQAVLSGQAQPIVPVLTELESALSVELPRPLYIAVTRVLSALKTLPLRAAAVRHAKAHVASATDESDVPTWVPPNRLLGGFYVLHALGQGGVGSVFVARRAEERDDSSAEVFALKVPEYNGEVARVLSEADFLKMFREEAGALLALPDDSANLARFVTFDAGVRPKPILVMEHVEGPSLERLLSRRQLDVSQAFGVLHGIASGLSAMHRTGIAHLDLKPSNVIMRDFWNGDQLTPVLVDFGLSGRRLRPGCGTPNYAGPEIWSATGTSSDDPRPADVYAFGCLAYELLTGSVLFDAPNDMAIVAAHMSHDGSPGQIQALHRDLSTRPLAEMLTGCLRQKPALRSGLTEVLAQLRFLRADLGARPWPLTPQPQAAVRTSRSS